MNQGISLSFVAKWQLRVVPAVLFDGSYTYNVDTPFVPVAEVYKPYNRNDFVGSDSDAQKALLGAELVDLLPSFTGHNLDVSQIAITPRRLHNRFFSETNEAIQEGDALMVVVPMM